MLLKKGVYPYKHMDEWEKFNETTLPENEEFYEIKHICKYPDLCLKRDTLLLADVFKNFRKLC